jgi:hypothetical protein
VRWQPTLTDPLIICPALHSALARFCSFTEMRCFHLTIARLAPDVRNVKPSRRAPSAASRSRRDARIWVSRFSSLQLHAYFCVALGTRGVQSHASAATPTLLEWHPRQITNDNVPIHQRVAGCLAGLSAPSQAVKRRRLQERKVRCCAHEKSAGHRHMPCVRAVASDALFGGSQTLPSLAPQKALRRASSWEPPAAPPQPLLPMARAASEFLTANLIPAAAAASSASGSPERGVCVHSPKACVSCDNSLLTSHPWQLCTLSADLRLKGPVGEMVPCVKCLAPLS